MRTVNKLIAVTPFETSSVKLEVSGGLARIKQKNELTKLTVVMSYSAENLCLSRGDEVFVRGDAMKQKFVSEVYEHGGETFILIPESVVVAVHDKWAEAFALAVPVPAAPEGA